MLGWIENLLLKSISSCLMVNKNENNLSDFLSFFLLSSVCCHFENLWPLLTE